MLNTHHKIISKQPGQEISIFAVMSKLANEQGAINLSQGFPDFDVSEELIKIVHEKMAGGNNQYAPMPGVLLLRERIAESVYSVYGASFDPGEEITITAGATEGLYSTITALVHHGDEVIIFEPCYDSYAPAIILSGGIPVSMKLKFPDYSIDWQEVKKSVSKKTSLMIINSPHNPTGAILKKEDFIKLSEIVKGTNILIISDEVYEHLIFDNEKHQSILLYPELVGRSVMIGSFGKSFHATGWKVGFCLAQKDISAEIRKVHQFVTFAVNTPVQHAFAEYIRKENIFSELGFFYQQKRDFFSRGLKGSRFKLMPCFGTYFQLLDYSAITDEKDFEFAKRLTKEIKVASIPVSSFYHDKTDNKVLRFCFAKREDTLEKAAERLCKV